MSKKKKPIPILDDVVRTGNTDKAVEGGIDPYPRKLAPRQQEVEVSADKKPPADKLTDQYAKKITKKSAKPAPQARPEKVAEQPAPAPPILTEKIAPARQPAKPAEQKKTVKQSNNDTETETLDLQPIIDKIIEEMIPDLEQHIRLQLRFELEKHLPRTITTSKNKDNK